MALAQLLPVILTLLVTGVAAGIMAGLLGVGGGIIMVPVLDAVLALLEVDPSVRLHIAIATSLAIIVPTSLSSSRAHQRRGSVDRDITRAWGLFILLGSVAGTLLASRLDSRVLALLFAVVAILVAIKLALPLDNLRLKGVDWGGRLVRLVPFSIGGLSCMIGIGGGSFSVPALTLMGVPIHRAVGTSALFGLLISLPGALTYVVSGWGDPRMPAGNLGYVSVFALLCMAPTTVLSAPLGARLAHRLSQRTLSLAFGLFLLLVGTRMLIKALA